MLRYRTCVLNVHLLWSDLHVEQRGFDSGMTHQLHKCGQTDTGPHHIGGKGVPKAMRIGPLEAGDAAMVAEQRT